MNSRSAFSEPNNLDRFAARVRSITVSAIKQMPLLAKDVPDCVSLGQGIPSTATPKFITEAVVSSLRSDPSIGMYTQQPGLPLLKEEIAHYLERHHGCLNVNPEKEIYVSCGGMEALATAICSIVERGDEVILLTPGYASHIEQVLFAEGVPVFVALEEGERWQLSISAVRKAVTPKTKAIVVCNPSNPTGTLLSPEEVRALASIALEFSLFLVADETYDFLVYDDKPFVSFTSIPELKSQLIACFSFSKQFCMTGWRVGFMYSSEVVVSQALKIHDAFAICAPAISQIAALNALQNSREENSIGAEFVNDLRNTLERRRDLALSLLSEMPSVFSCSTPEGAYYLFPKFLPEDIDSVALALELLYEARVITIPGSAFGPSGAGHLRFSFGGTEDSIIEAFRRIRNWASNKGWC